MTEEALWKKFSRWVREKAAVNNMIQCYTCPTIAHINIMDAGHFIDRRWRPTKFDLRNVKPQCRVCNRSLDGNLKVFERELIKEYGEGIIEELKDLSISGPLPSHSEILTTIT